MKNDQICQKTIGTKLVIQWTGSLFFVGTPVAFQAILDGSDGSIEYVYDASQAALGDGATIGVENATGDEATQLGFNKANAIAPASSKKFTHP